MPLLRRIYYSLPLSWRKLVRKLYFLPRDIFTSQDKRVPHNGDNYTGSGDFIDTGKEFLQYFIDFGCIDKDYSLLEIGCGMGRMALPLQEYLSARGQYHGIDVVQEGIDWCRQRITPGDSRFTYTHAPIYNKLYNPDSTLLTTEYSLPLEDNSIDFVFLTSVFTHLLPHEVEHYLSEIYRVLRPNGKVLATFFVLDDFSIKKDKNATIYFPYHYDDYAIMDKNIPEANVAYSLTYLKKKYVDLGFKDFAIHHGSWCGRVHSMSFQDIVIVQK